MSRQLAFDPAETGLADRLATDPAYAGLLGNDEDGEVRLYWGWPHDVLDAPQAGHFPRATFLRVPGGGIRRPGFGRVRVQLDHWLWPSGASGGKTRLGELDGRAVELLDEQHWTHDGCRLYAVAQEPLDFPAAPGMPIRRMRRFDIDVSPAS